MTYFILKVGTGQAHSRLAFSFGTFALQGDVGQEGKNWRASMASVSWREHLLRQAEWIMEILTPDAIVVDETFAGLGYDYHPDRAGPMSAGSIDFYRKLRSLVRSYGADRAVFSSDCSLAPFVYWFDGECGDHAYKSLLGRPSYTQEPVRFMAALGDKPWRPCSWHFQGMWDAQMKLARQVGAGVGVSNGWIEYTGLAGLSAAAKARILVDIKSLFCESETDDENHGNNQDVRKDSENHYLNRPQCKQHYSPKINPRKDSLLRCRKTNHRQ